MLPCAGDEGKKAGSPGDVNPEDVRFDWDTFYLAARRMGIQPSEFWDMTLPEFFAEVYGADTQGRQSSLTQDDRERFTGWLNGE